MFVGARAVATAAYGVASPVKGVEAPGRAACLDAARAGEGTELVAGLDCVVCGEKPYLRSDRAKAAEQGWYWCWRCRSNRRETGEVFCERCGGSPNVDERQEARKENGWRCLSCREFCRDCGATALDVDERQKASLRYWWQCPDCKEKSRRRWEEHEREERRERLRRRERFRAGITATGEVVGAVPECRECGQLAGPRHDCCYA